MQFNLMEGRDSFGALGYLPDPLVQAYKGMVSSTQTVDCFRITCIYCFSVENLNSLQALTAKIHCIA